MEREGSQQPIEENFRFTKAPEIRGVSKELLIDLKDIVQKFGSIIPDEGMLSFDEREEDDGLSLHISASLNPNSPTFLLVGITGESMSQGTSLLYTNKGAVLWDKKLSAKDTKEAVKRIDNLALEAGFKDPKTGERIPIPAESRLAMPGKFKASVLETGSVFLIPPNKDPEEMLAQSDEPEKLEIITDPNNSPVIIRKEDRQSYERRRSTGLEVVKELGLSTNDLAQLSFERILELREVIEQRLKEVDES